MRNGHLSVQIKIMSWNSSKSKLLHGMTHTGQAEGGSIFMAFCSRNKSKRQLALISQDIRERKDYSERIENIKRALTCM